jgi:molybdenum cofactor guanylyltransferase
MNNDIIVMILAGGKSSRMGQDKALLEFQGKPLLTRISQMALSLTDQVYLVTSRGEKYQHILPFSCQIVQENNNFPGALVAFYQALKQINPERKWVLLLACDLPYINQETIQKWIDQLDNIPSETIAFLPRQEERWQCLSGFYRSSCLPLLEAFIQEGGNSFQKWLNSASVAEIYLDDPEVVFNCNTPEDWQKIQS